MSLQGRKALAKKLLEECEAEESGVSLNAPYQDTDFENPFNTCPPAKMEASRLFKNYNYRNLILNTFFQLKTKIY